MKKRYDLICLFSGWLVVVSLLAACSDSQNEKQSDPGPVALEAPKIVMSENGSTTEVPLMDHSGMVSENFTVTVKQESKIDNPETELVIAKVRDTLIKVQQCGVYSFRIVFHGEVTEVNHLQYAGEAQLEVARGVGWSVVISRLKSLED